MPGPIFTFLGRDTDCYDGLRNFNQARPALFDGGYAFSSIFADNATGEPTFNNPLSCDGVAGDCTPRQYMRPLPAGKYVVKMIVPPGYKVQKEEDKNVDFGDQYVPAEFWIPGQDLAIGGPSDPMTTSRCPSAAWPPN